LKTKRWWIVMMQIFIGAGFAGIAFTIPLPVFFQASLAFFWLLAFSSATHDIAADGFYMLGLDTNQQAAYVGIRNTFYRIATITGQGILLILAGFLESSSGREPVVISIEASPQYTQTVLQLPPAVESHELDGDLRFIVDNVSLQVGTQVLNKEALKVFVDEIVVSNQSNGFVIKEKDKDKKQKKWWTIHVSQPLGDWIKTNFGEKREVFDDKTGNVALVSVRLSKKPEAGKEIVLNTTQNRGDKSISIVQGERLTFNASNWNKPAYLLFQVDSKLTATTSAEYKGMSGNIPFAWSITFFVLAGLFFCFSFYHKFFLPKPESDTSRALLTTKDILKEFSITFASFFKKKQTGAALFFMLTFRFSEAQLLKLLSPFLLDAKDTGGLGLTTGEVGLVYGTVGIIGLTLGGIIGGIAAAKGGLKKWLWPMTLSMLLTIATFLYLSFSQTGSLLVINICVFVEQFGYGFGFTAYMLYLIYYSDGEHKTAHYAICTGFMALGMMLPGMFAGWLQELLGYNHFFIWVMICSIVPIIAVSLLKIDPEFGKKNKKL
jgi:PAT family beta-lactamase induction signal transducer AmpG